MTKYPVVYLTVVLIRTLTKTSEQWFDSLRPCLFIRFEYRKQI